MDVAGDALFAANNIYIRATNHSTNGTDTNPDTTSRPPVYKAIGISLAVASGLFIGVSFVLKKVGLLKANEKYAEVAGEGYGYLKNAFWWTGMTLMIIGEICNFVAYAFVDAILVTPLGALSVVITTILSAIFLKERLSLVGMVGCFLCIVGSVVIVMNSPSEASAATIQEMQHFVIAPGFLSYTGIIIIGCAFVAFWAGPRYGKKSMMVYLTICSLIGGLSVVATQGLGAAIVTQIGGVAQFNQWFLYVLLVFVIATLLTEIVFLNKALNLFNAALVTPTYYVYFTSSTIITSAILFRGFKGTPTSIITVVMGFFVICSGVVLLQLSKSAKDVPDAAVFSGDLNQVRTIAEQEQPESEPKADAIRGAGLGTIVRRMSVSRQRMEMDEARRLHEETAQALEPVGEDEFVEWDGLRRRKTTIGSRGPSSRYSATPRLSHTPVPHPPLGMSRFPTYDDDHNEENQPSTGGLASSIIGTIRSRTRSVLPSFRQSGDGHGSEAQSPMHPVPLTQISLPDYKTSALSPSYDGAYFNEHVSDHATGFTDQSTAYEGGGSRHIQFSDAPPRLGTSSSGATLAPTPPPHSARRQFSFHNVFRRSHGGSVSSAEEPTESKAVGRAGLGSRQYSHLQTKGGITEEERMGLVKGDTNLTPVASYADDDEDEDSADSVDWESEVKGAFASTSASASPTRDPGRVPKIVVETEDEGRPLPSGEDVFEQRRRRREQRARGESSGSPPSGDPVTPSPGAFI
ncbi:MAG: hypothetical protein M1818_000525 [Claussenomyces sp. TS43310]|nr:MAG: hypothetical protein M1818_000525 [Claussenomyces sp. TS43310]